MTTDETQRLVDEYQLALIHGDLARADVVSADLRAHGVTLEVTKDGVRWRKEVE